MEDSDLVLVQALQAGDDRAFDKLLRRHTDAVYRFVRRYVESDADAEDLTQEAFVRAYFRVRDFGSRAKFVTWLFRIAHKSLHRLFAQSPLSRRSETIFG